MTSFTTRFSCLFTTLVLLLSFHSISHSQDIDSIDIIFNKAKQTAFNNQYEEARILCFKILDKNPMYFDAKVLIASSLAWEKQYDSALVLLNEVIRAQYGHQDALYAMCDIYTWKNDLENAKKYCEIGLSFHPGDSLFELKNNRISNLATPPPAPPVISSESIKKPAINLDSLFLEAQQLAFDNKYKKARKKSSEILSHNEKYLDAYSLISRTYAWKEKFDTARIVIGKALTIDPIYRDGLLTRVDIELWDGQYDLVIKLCDAALAIYPDDQDFIDRKLKALEAKKKISNPDSTQLPTDTLTNSLILEYYYDYYNLPYVRHFHMFSLGYGKKTSFGDASAKLNIGHRISDGITTTNTQFSLETYPIITKKSYGYAAYAISSGNIFPNHRIGLEYFQGLMWGMEVSVGFRYMDWYNNILVYTGSFSQYIKKNWLCFRPFITSKQSIYTNSYLLTYRRYFNVPGYAFVSFLTGHSPDQPLYLLEQDGTYESNKLTAGLYKSIKLRYYAGIMFGYQYEEYLLGYHRNRYDMLLSLRYKF